MTRRNGTGILNKPVTNEQILRIAGWMHKYGIAFGSSAFFGLPGDTVDDHMARLPFFRQVNPKYCGRPSSGPTRSCT
ncbi:MAG: hypothetical protein R2708_05225 [Vicinamibacterales bacterium]